MFKFLYNVSMSLKNTHNFSVFSVVSAKSHYDSLGVTPNATQNEIKSAYYKLSMKLHPDKNKGSEEAAQKFRDITSAYEVLGSYRLRKMYDKGLIHTVQDQIKHRQEDDDETKFYKSRFTRSQAPPPSGRPTIYNFDEWSRAHYGITFARSQTEKENRAQKAAQKIRYRGEIQSEIAMYTIGFFFLLLCAAASSFVDDYDQVKEKPNQYRS